MADDKPAAAPAPAAQPVAADKPPAVADPPKPAAKAEAAPAGEKPAADPAPPKPEEKPKEPALSEFSQLAREQRALRKDREALEAEKRRITSESTTAQKELAELRAFKAKLKTPEAMAALRAEGLTYKDLVRQETALLEAENSPEAKRIAALEQKLAAKEKAEQDAQLAGLRQQREQARRGVLDEIGTFVKGAAEKYELITAYEANEHVFAEMQRVFDETVKRDEAGNVVSFKQLSVQEACDAIEKRFDEAADKLLKTKKIQDKIAAAKATPAPDGKPAPKEKPVTKKLFERPEPKPATLDNSLTQGVPPEKPLSREERIARAYERFASSQAQARG